MKITVDAPDGYKVYRCDGCGDGEPCIVLLKEKYYVALSSVCVVEGMHDEEVDWIEIASSCNRDESGELVDGNGVPDYEETVQEEADRETGCEDA